MKIAFFVWEFYPRIAGGLGTYAVELCQEFVKAGHDVVIFTLNPGDLPTHELWRGIFIHRPKIVDLSAVFPFFVTEDLRRWGTNLRMFCDVFSYNHLSASKLVNELIRKDETYDIVAVHDWLSAVAGMIIHNERPNIPVAFHVHSTEQIRAQDLGSEVIRHLEYGMAKEANTVITVSFAMKDHLRSLGYPLEKIRVVWNGVDPEKYHPDSYETEAIQALKERYGISNSETVVLFVGRITRIKGVHNLIQAIPFVISKFPKSHFVILGKGDEVADLSQLTRRLGIEKQVSFRNEFVSENERIQHYALSDVCVFPSLSEPFGIVCLEAMSMAKPVVVGARDTSGFREQVVPSGPDQCGVHVDPEDPSDIAWGLNVVLEDLDRAKIWGKNGRKRVLQYFRWEIVAKNTVDVYQEAILKRAWK